MRLRFVTKFSSETFNRHVEKLKVLFPDSRTRGGVIPSARVLCVDNQGLLPWRLRRVGRSTVRSASLVRVLSYGKISWAQGPKVRVILHLPQLKQSNTCSFEKKKKEEKRKPEGETPALVAFESY